MCRPHVILTAAALLPLILAPVASAPQSAVETDAKAAYEHELARLRQREPQEYLETTRTLTFSTELLLARLGYGTGPLDGVFEAEAESALREYQQRRGIPATGNPLSFETVQSVARDRAALEDIVAYLPGCYVYTELWDSGYVTASGSWTIKGEEIACPQQTSTIVCDRSTQRCTEATARLSSGQGQPLLSVDIATYEIERWDQHEIVTKPLEAACTRLVKRINRLDQGVSAIRSTIASDGLCEGVHSGEMYLVLVDGSDVYRRLYKAQREKWRELMRISPQMLRQLEGRGDETR